MKNIFRVGDQKEYRRIIGPDDVAAFHGIIVHPVCATFALARDVEWTSRLFVLEMCDPDEEGIGTLLTVDHKRPAFVGEELLITARIEQVNGHEMICSYEVTVNERLVATGKTGQKIFKKKRIEQIFGQSK